MERFIIKENSTLLEALLVFFPDSSKTQLQKWLREGRIEMDGHPVKTPHLPVKKGQKLVLSKKRDPQKKTLLNIVYRDSHLIVLDKPYGLLSVDAETGNAPSLHRYLKQEYSGKKINVLHRLDRETSGLILFPLTEECFRLLKQQLKERKIKRSYTALVENTPQPTKGTWKCRLCEDKFFNVFPTQDPTKGEEAITHYQLLFSKGKYSRLNLELETGKKHQIRVHCQMAGCPIVGDKKYDALSSPIKRLCLHAHTLSFIHPITGKALTFSSPEPELFDRVVPKHRMSKYDTDA